MNELAQTAASPLFTFLIGLVAGALGYRWLTRNQAERLAALEAKLAELDDKRRG